MPDLVRDEKYSAKKRTLRQNVNEEIMNVDWTPHKAPYESEFLDGTWHNAWRPKEKEIGERLDKKLGLVTAQALIELDKVLRDIPLEKRKAIIKDLPPHGHWYIHDDDTDDELARDAERAVVGALAGVPEPTFLQGAPQFNYRPSTHSAEPITSSEIKEKLTALNFKHRKALRSIQRESIRLTGRSQWGGDTVQREGISSWWDTIVDRCMK